MASMHFFSKSPKVVLIPNQDAFTVVEVLLDNVIARQWGNGTPCLARTSLRGCNFESEILTPLSTLSLMEWLKDIIRQ